MADGINFNLLGVGELSPYQQAQQRDMQNQLAQQQLATGRIQQEQAQMSLAQAKRDQEALVKLREIFVANGHSPDLSKNFQAMVESGIPHYVDIGMKGIQMLEGQRRFRELTGGTPVSAAEQPQPSEGLAVTSPVPDTMPTNALAPQAPAAAPVDELQNLENKIMAAYEIGTPASIAWAQAREKELAELRKPQVVAPGASVLQGGKSVFTAPEKAPSKPTLVQEYEFAKTPAGGSFKGTLEQYKRREQQPATPAAPVAVIDPATGKPKYVSRETAIEGGLAPATTEAKPMTALQQQKLNKDRAADSARIRSATSTADELESLADRLLGNPKKKIAPHEGLSGITGYQSYLPSLPEGAARAAQQQLDTFKGKVMALGRQIASQEGKLGNMAVQEWKFVTDAVEKIDPASSNFDAQLRDVVRQARNLENSLKETYTDTYEAEPPAPKAPAAKPALSPQDKEALDWANANPKDPRAAKIKQRLGQ